MLFDIGPSARPASPEELAARVIATASTTEGKPGPVTFAMRDDELVVAIPQVTGTGETCDYGGYFLPNYGECTLPLVELQRGRLAADGSETALDTVVIERTNSLQTRWVPVTATREGIFVSIGSNVRRVGEEGLEDASGTTVFFPGEAVRWSGGLVLRREDHLEVVDEAGAILHTIDVSGSEYYVGQEFRGLFASNGDEILRLYLSYTDVTDEGSTTHVHLERFAAATGERLSSVEVPALQDLARGTIVGLFFNGSDALLVFLDLQLLWIDASTGTEVAQRTVTTGVGAEFVSVREVDGRVFAFLGD